MTSIGQWMFHQKSDVAPAHVPAIAPEPTTIPEPKETTPMSTVPVTPVAPAEILPPATPAIPGGGPTPPVKPHGFKNFMDHVGHAFGEVFAYLGSAKGQRAIAAVEGTSVVIATAAFSPAAGAALAGVEALINAGIRQVVSIESVAAAAGASTGTGTQKAAAVTTAMTPQIASFLQSIGVSEPRADQVQALGTAISTALVAVLNSIPAPTAPAA
jgi:hypothetical protein